MAELRCDVCVVGAGASGMAAAVSAARAGASVILVERYGFLGGMGTGAIIGTFCGLYSSGPVPAPIETGFGWTVVRALIARRAAYRFSFGRTRLVHYDAEALKRAYDELAIAAGVRVLAHTTVIGAEVKDGIVTSIQAHTQADPIRIAAAIYIDASGDAILCHRAGARTELGDGAGRVQPATLVFRMAHVDLAAALRVGREELNRRMREDAAAGTFRLPRTSGSFYRTMNRGEVVVNMTRVRTRGLDPDDLSQAELEARRQVDEYARWLRARIPGFAAAFVSASGTQIGLRETRRIVGRVRLAAEDLRNGRRWPDELGTGAWPFEIHAPDGDGTRLEWLPDGVVYGVPLAAARSADLHNVVVAGRCLGTTPEAHASTRVMGSCFAVGEAAGAVAAARSRDGRDVDVAIGETLAGVRAWRGEACEPPEAAWPEPPPLEEGRA